jgi:hypothetical protein
MNLVRILIEMIIIGIVTAIVLFLLTFAIEPDTTLKILALGFLTGALVHFMMEILGANDKYCEMRNKIYN